MSFRPPRFSSPAVAGRLRILSITLAWAGALGVAAWIGSGLFWRLAAPPVAFLPVSHDTDPQAVARRIAGYRPFAGQSPATDEAANAPAALAPIYRLHGLATGFVGGPGFALVSAGDGPVRAVAAGEEIDKGIRVARILPDGVELDQGGRVVMLRLPVSGAEAGLEIVSSESAGAQRPLKNNSPTESSQ